LIFKRSFAKLEQKLLNLGDIPFEGLSWTPGFSGQLIEGLRLPVPSFNCHGM